MAGLPPPRRLEPIQLQCSRAGGARTDCWIMTSSHVPCYVWEYTVDVTLQNPDGQEVSMSKKQIWLVTHT